ETSRMVNLGGYFAMMLIVAGTDPVIADIREQLRAFGGRVELRCEMLPMHKPSAPGRKSYFRLISRGADRAGGLHQISHLLRTLGVNIESDSRPLESAAGTAAEGF